MGHIPIVATNFINNVIDQSYYFSALVIIAVALVLFVLSFEKRKPRTREVILMAVMVSIAVVGRLVFFAVPHIKPCAAIIIIVGMMLGKQAGFLCGVLTAFISDFFFGVGPWTPFQMIAFGLIGLLAAVFFNPKTVETTKGFVAVLIYGFVATFIIYGLIMDTATVMMFTDKVKWTSLLATYATGLIYNIIHAASTVAFLWLLARVMQRKLQRMMLKYNIQ